MSWLNHFLDYETIKEGFDTGTNKPDIKDKVGDETDPVDETGEAGYDEEGPTGETGGSEDNSNVDQNGYKELFSDIQVLSIYYGIFLGGLFLGGPILFYYFLLYGSNYFPTAAQEYKENTTPSTTNTRINLYASEYLKFPEIEGEAPEWYKLYLFTNPKNFSNCFYLPTQEINGSYGKEYQSFVYRYFQCVFAGTLIWFSYMMNQISLLGPGLAMWIVLVITAASFFSVYYRASDDPGNKDLTRAYNYKNAIWFFLLIISGYGLMPIAIILIALGMIIWYSKEFLNKFTGSDYIWLWQDNSGWGTKIVYGIVRFILWIFCMLFASIISVIVLILLMCYFLSCLFGVGCIILKPDVVERLNILTLHKLVGYFCCTSVPHIVTFLLFIFIIIACTIDTNKNSNIKFGAWVSVITVIIYYLLYEQIQNSIIGLTSILKGASEMINENVDAIQLSLKLGEYSECKKLSRHIEKVKKDKSKTEEKVEEEIEKEIQTNPYK
jgi:hypothetical protein